MELALLIDFGSTYTKVAAIDLDREEVAGWSQSVTTVNENVMVGLNDALDALRVRGKPVRDCTISAKLACSSAAGGLRLISIGLVPTLTLEAATRAALGAGAKVVGSYCYEMTPSDAREIEDRPCDMVLLAGGTDGGEKKTIIHNARVLASIKKTFPIVVAGNRAARDAVTDILAAAGKEAMVTENVLPTLDNINVEPTRSAIREVFMRRIVQAKGIDQARQFVSDIVMPTPMAVLKAAQLIAEGAAGQPGLGDLIVVDVGGATTDVCSIGTGLPTRGGVLSKGLPEPYSKRTVEGDLGIRYNARTILDIAGPKRLLENLPRNDLGIQESDMTATIERLASNVGHVPEGEAGQAIDCALAFTATEEAMERHAGHIHQIMMPTGPVEMQYGKDLTNFRGVIGTGGVFVHNRYGSRILEATLFDHSSDPFLLKPASPEFFFDESYILFAVGLLSRISPAKAFGVARKSLRSLAPQTA